MIQPLDDLFGLPLFALGLDCAFRPHPLSRKWPPTFVVSIESERFRRAGPVVTIARDRVDRKIKVGSWQRFEVLCETFLHVGPIECDDNYNDCWVNCLR